MATNKLFPIRESKIEKYLVDRVKLAGGDTIKMNQGEGMPDRLVLYKGWAGFVELKREGLTFEKKQIYQRERLKRLGFDVRLLDSKASVDGYIWLMKNER